VTTANDDVLGFVRRPEQGATHAIEHRRRNGSHSFVGRPLDHWSGVPLLRRDRFKEEARHRQQDVVGFPDGKASDGARWD
jgi:hypothetical protein